MDNVLQALLLRGVGRDPSSVHRDRRRLDCHTLGKILNGLWVFSNSPRKTPIAQHSRVKKVYLSQVVESLSLDVGFAVLAVTAGEESLLEVQLDGAHPQLILGGVTSAHGWRPETDIN